MPRPRKTAPDKQAAAPAAPTSPARGFPRRAGTQATPLTSEAIAADVDSFRKAGGEIEVLGVTRTLHKIGKDGQTGGGAK